MADLKKDIKKSSFRSGTLKLIFYLHNLSLTEGTYGFIIFSDSDR